MYVGFGGYGPPGRRLASAAGWLWAIMDRRVRRLIGLLVGMLGNVSKGMIERDTRLLVLNA